MSNGRSESLPVLADLTSPPKFGLSKLYRWCDYIELRCLVHQDKRFSRDFLSESLDENRDTNADEATSYELSEDQDDSDYDIAGLNYEGSAVVKDLEEGHAAFCFKHLRWRSTTFGESWPFTIDEHAQEIRLKSNLTDAHKFYLSLLLSGSLAYVPQKRWRELTGLFERASTHVMKHLMPVGAEVHAFGAAESTRYRGHLFDRLTTLAKDVSGHFNLKKHHFANNDSGDSGLDIVAWHDLGDGRPGIPIAFAQCGCTATGWPDKMLQASPARLAGHLTTLHDWSTYYFTPLDLATENENKLDWQHLSDFGKAIVVDRLRFMRLSEKYGIEKPELTATDYISEAMALNQN
jgi:hypothetical protein